MPFTVRSERCWLVLMEGDWLGCGLSMRRAVALAAGVWGAEVDAGAVTTGPPVLARADVPCVEMSCRRCGSWWTDPESGERLHGLTEDDARVAAADVGWVGDVCPVCRRVV